MWRRDCGIAARATLDGKPNPSHNGRHERPSRNLRHLPGDYSLAHSWLRPSFLKIRDRRPAKPEVSRGPEALRYVVARETGIRADRPVTRAHVCVRTDGLRLRPYRQCAPGHRVRRAVPIWAK